jgi:hypothetical protein
MTGPPAARPATQSAPSVNRASNTVMVRMADGELAGRVSEELANRLVASGAAKPIGKVRLRYLQLQSGFVITKSSQGWALIEEERRKHGDNAVRRGLMSNDRRPTKWQAPTQR